MLNGLDLFSGIGGIALALSPWVRTVAYCESDRYAQAVLLSRMQSGDLERAPIWDDVRTLRGDMLPPIDIISGGFPCQDISVAGNGAGLEGARSGLFFEIVRLATELKPTLLFLENVPAIRTRGGERVGRELARLGYDCRWGVLRASDLGAPHERARWWCVAAHADNEALRLQQRRWGGPDGKPAILHSDNGDTRLVAWTSERGFESRVFRTGYGIPFAMDRDRVLGNSVVPTCAREAFKQLVGLS